METIIGLGQAGCSIAEKFKQYPQYDVYRLDSEKRTGSKFKLLKNVIHMKSMNQLAPI